MRCDASLSLQQRGGKVNELPYMSSILLTVVKTRTKTPSSS